MRLPFPHIEPAIWQIPVLVLIQVLFAYAFNIAGWKVDPVTFFFIPLIFGILFWKERSFKIIADYFGFNTKNIVQKILASIAGICLGISLYLLLKFGIGSVIAPFTSWLYPVSLPGKNIITGILEGLPTILFFILLIFVGIYAVTGKVPTKGLAAVLIALLIPFIIANLTPGLVLNLLIGYGEELLCLLFAMIAINWLVYKYSLKYNDTKTHAIAWMISRASWAVIHAVGVYNTIMAYIMAFILGMVFTAIGYMFWFGTIGGIIMLLIGLYDIYLYAVQGITLSLICGAVLMTLGGLLLLEPYLLRDESLRFKEYVIYAPAFAHAFYDYAFLVL